MSRRFYVLATALAVLLVAMLTCISVTPRLIWNASASVPVGLYALHPDARPGVGDLIAVRPPALLARFLAERHYLPLDVPLMKHVAARPGQEVCRQDRTITVDGVPFGDALDRDRLGRPLPVWRGCRRLGTGELFLMNGAVPDSLDGRYFGPLPASTVIGTATPLYTDEDGDGRFVWRAPTR
ncbi:S26 family signal peptidase [Sphingomonas adhaesiva]|uniref:S26 family signal peptidase n=1 Tax=Sphingomonas adhaesiva TaxID=28212 RepID=UPI002FFB174F